eukprot:GHVT01075721.1.p4 GENE.GHVT01075721.1~~GHVT01075721.1.p4  ORF type:complete len:145 (+),score=45.80 GHVT01075721.1:569-1003(+)
MCLVLGIPPLRPPPERRHGPTDGSSAGALLRAAPRTPSPPTNTSNSADTPAGDGGGNKPRGVGQVWGSSASAWGGGGRRYSAWAFGGASAPTMAAGVAREGAAEAARGAATSPPAGGPPASPSASQGDELPQWGGDTWGGADGH